MTAFSTIADPAFLAPSWTLKRPYALSALEARLTGGEPLTGDLTVQLVNVYPWLNGYDVLAEVTIVDTGDSTPERFRAISLVYDDDGAPVMIPAGAIICAIHDRKDFLFPDGERKSDLSVDPKGTDL